jgi:hypothetical protein
VALVSSYDWTWKNKTGTSPSLKKMVIEDLQLYSSPDEEDDEIL